MSVQSEETTVRLLRIAGVRQPVPGDRAARVRAAVHADWSAAKRRSGNRRRVVATAGLLAAAAVVALAVGRVLMVEQPPAATAQMQPVATIDRLEGEPRRNVGPETAAALIIRVADSVRVGDWIVTDARARVGLRFSNATSVRLDVSSRARIVSAETIELVAGAVYVDSGGEAGHFEVRTPLATARVVGTQFEVRLVEAGLRLRVRSGLVELNDGGRRVSGSGGTEVMFSSTGAVSRPIAPHGSDWDWTAQVSPFVEIEGMALSTFLDRVAHENGWTLRYQDATLAARAAGIVLHGSFKELSLNDALDVAITTSGLRHGLKDGDLVVWEIAEEP